MRLVKTPSEVNQEVRLHLEAGFPRVWIEGEITNLSRPASGHLYFSLKDQRAQLSCALFRSSAKGLGFRPENGQLVQARGRLTLYEARGNYQLIVDAMEAAGEGLLRAAFEALKGKLETEGLFDAGAKQALPNAPRRIAVITSASGAVIRDIIHVMGRRWPLAAIRLYPVPVQGEEAAPAIVKALAAANRQAWADVIILGRGGGSLEDLWAFNEETVARAIVASDLPVVSAVGHETDFSISDFVADVRAPTPSAAAEILTPDQTVVARALQASLMQLGRRWEDGMARRSQNLDHLAHRLQQHHPERAMARLNERLSNLRQRLSATGQRLVPGRLERLQALDGRLARAAGRLLPDRQRQLSAIARTLHAVSPLPTLDRGYAIVTDASTGASLGSVAGIAPGQAVVARLSDGQLHATVDSIEPGSPSDIDQESPPD